MEISGGDVIARALKEYGINSIFTLCGGHISPLLVGCKRCGIDVIDMRCEENAVFAADAAARLTGVPGVAAVTAGPGITNSITALKNAQMAQSPVVLLGGAAATFIKGRGSLQDIDPIPILESVVKMAVSITRNCDIIPVLELAFKVAKIGVPGPVFVECPIDLLYEESIVRKWYGTASGDSNKKSVKSKLFQFYLQRHVDRMFSCDFDEMQASNIETDEVTISEAKVVKAMKRLNQAKRPVLIVGSQAMHYQLETLWLVEAIEKLGIPTYLTGMARGLMGPSHPLQLKHKRKNALQKADVVVLAGMPCDFRLGYGRVINSDATLLSINRSKDDLNLNRKPDIGILSDPHHFLCAMAEYGHTHPDQWLDWQHELSHSDKQRDIEINELADESTDFINPLRFLLKLDDFLAPNSVIVADGGDFVATASYILRPRSALSWLDPGVFGTLGVGAGFAIGAKLSRPDDEIWLIYGDGAAGYSLVEFDTCVRHNIPVIAVVGNDGSWNQIARDQVELLKDDVGTVLQRTSYHEVAKGYGAKGFLLERNDQIDAILKEAREAAKNGKPVLINVQIGRTDFRKGSISM